MTLRLKLAASTMKVLTAEHSYYSNQINIEFTLCKIYVEQEKTVFSVLISQRDRL